MTGLIISYQNEYGGMDARTWTRMVALPLSPHEFNCAARSNLSCLGHWHIVRAVDANVASNSVGLYYLVSAGVLDVLGISNAAYSKEAVRHGSIVLELAGDLVHSCLLRVLVGIPSIDEILAQPDLLDKSVSRRQGREAQDSSGSSGPHCDRKCGRDGW